MEFHPLTQPLSHLSDSLHKEEAPLPGLLCPCRDFSAIISQQKVSRVCAFFCNENDSIQFSSAIFYLIFLYESSILVSKVTYF